VPTTGTSKGFYGQEWASLAAGKREYAPHQSHSGSGFAGTGPACPLDVIAHVLGHDNLDATAHHPQVSTRLMMDTYNGAHPHARRRANAK
jgi:hypothetical protein